jgi:hypothetical protein
MTENTLRSLIRETLLRETRITPESLPDGVIFILNVSSTGGNITLEVERDGVDVGTIEANRVRGEENPCWGAYEVGRSKTGIKGLGPLMYDIVMELATEIGGGLISDRWAVSPSARNVWQKYQDSRPDVERLQLDSPENEITPARKDNCNVKVSKIYSGSGELSKWRDHPLSGAYRKPGLSTIRQLTDMGKLRIRGFEL